ncbi:MAG: ABC transporter ATP-binding protein [bacterium]
MLLEAYDIEKSFGAHRVLDGVSLTVDSGEAVAILGANGAGKTTLLRIVTLLLPPDSGTLLFDSHPLCQADLGAMGYLPEERGLYRRMRAGEQVVYLARLKGLSRSDATDQARQWFERLGAADWWSRPVSRLSKGMQQRVQFIATVVHRPRLLILDEPFSGFDADNTAMLHREIERLRSQGTAILLSTHNLQAANTLCSKTIQL